MEISRQCRICDAVTENIGKHLNDLHEVELQLALFTDNTDDVSLWIRQCKAEQLQEMISTVPNEVVELNPLMNSTADEECPNEEEFAANYQLSFINESNFESSNSFENSAIDSSAMEVNEATDTAHIESSHKATPNSNSSRESIVTSSDEMSGLQELENFNSSSNSIEIVGSLPNKTVANETVMCASDNITAEAEVMDNEGMGLDGDVDLEDGTPRSELDERSVVQRFQQMIDLHVPKAHTTATGRKPICRLCGQANPKKHTHVLRHMNIPDMFTCSFCDLKHPSNRQVIVEHGKRKHGSYAALISQEDKYAAEITATWIRCFSTSPHFAESLRSSNRTKNVSQPPASSASNEQSSVGASVTSQKDITDRNGQSLSWSPNCNICGQATMKKFRHALRHLNQFDMFSCTLCPFSHPWNSHIVENHLALRHNVSVELTAVLVSSRLGDFEMEISAMHRRCFKADSTSFLLENGNADSGSRRSALSHSDAPFQAKSACASIAQNSPAPSANALPPVRLVTANDNVSCTGRLPAAGGSCDRAVHSILKAYLNHEAAARRNSGAPTNDHVYNRISSSTLGAAQLNRVCPRIAYPTNDRISP